MKLLVASNNPNKLREIKQIFDLHNFKELELVPAKDYDVPSPAEQGSSFQDNALIKARYYRNIANIPVIAEDSGLSIEGLNGLPGVFSARWADEGNFQAAFEKIKNIMELKSVKNNKANFNCSVCFINELGEEQIFTGKLEGEINFPPRGKKGFGYDPIFIPKGGTKTLGELGESYKNNHSHRTKAIAQFISWYQQAAA